MSASHAIFSFTVFAGLILAGDYVIFHQQNKVLSQTGSEAGSYWDYLSRRLTATRTPEVETRLSDFLPAAAEGWTRAPYVRADGEAVTGRRYIETSLAVDTTNDLLGKLEADFVNTSHAAETYLSGDRRVIVAISHRPTDWGFDPTSRMVAAVTLAIGSSAGSGETFGSVKGVTFRQKPQVNHDNLSNTDSPVDYRHFAAALGDTLTFQVVTNAPDADVQAILGQIDMVGLAALAEVPEAIVNDQRPTVWGAAAAAASGTDHAAANPPKDASESGLFAALGTSVAAGPAPARTVPQDDEAGSLLDIAKPAQGTCVRRAGELICP